MKKFNLPLLLLGGGGYSIHSVAKAWAFETGVAAGQKLGSCAFLIRGKAAEPSSR